MSPDRHYLTLERAIARSLRPFVSELRLVDLVDFIDHVVNERAGTVAEIIDQAAELHFVPGFIAYDDNASVAIDWEERPCVSLGIRLCATPFECRVRVGLRADHAMFELQHLSGPKGANAVRPDPSALHSALVRNALHAMPPHRDASGPGVQGLNH